MNFGNFKCESELKQLTETFKTVFRNEVESKSTIDKPLEEENQKNPMLLRPVIRSVLKFLNIEDIKNCRLVCHEWGSTGILTLANRAIITFQKDDNQPARLPVDFLSLFLNSATLFSAFRISCDFTMGHKSNHLTIEELTNFFAEHQKYIKELTLKFEYLDEDVGGTIPLSSWISKSLMVQKDAKYMTKLSIEDGGKCDILNLDLITHIKDLSLINCKIKLTAGIQICSVKLKLENSSFYQDGMKLDRVLINDIVDFSKTKDVSLGCDKSTKYVLDLRGNATLDKLTLIDVEIVNGEISNWSIDRLWTSYIPYSLNSLMNIKEFGLLDVAISIDLSTLPKSLRKLSLHAMVYGPTIVKSSQSIVLENLKSLKMCAQRDYYSFLSYFTNCPLLTHLTLEGNNDTVEMKSLWIPKSVKSLTLTNVLIKWVHDDNYLNLEKLFVIIRGAPDKQLCHPEIQVEDFIVYILYLEVNKNLVDFLQYRNQVSFGKRLYIGELDWSDEELEDSVLKDHVDGQSSFYVFQNGEKGLAISEEIFSENIPKQTFIDIDQCIC